MPAEAKYTAVAHSLFNKRAITVGSRSRLLSGGTSFVLDSGALNLKLGCYEVALGAEGAILEVIHRPSGVRAPVSADEGLDSSWGIANNFSDARALRKRHQAECAHRYLLPKQGWALAACTVGLQG